MYYGVEAVPVNLSVKNVPDEIVEKLRKRAKGNYRSLQGELMAILEDAAGPDRLSLHEAEKRLGALSFKTGNDSTALVRELRDAR